MRPAYTYFLHPKRYFDYIWWTTHLRCLRINRNDEIANFENFFAVVGNIAYDEYT